MAISVPAPEATANQQVGRERGELQPAPSLIVDIGHILRRGYERLCSAIFDPEGDCMRL